MKSDLLIEVNCWEGLYGLDWSIVPHYILVAGRVYG